MVVMPRRNMRSDRDPPSPIANGYHAHDEPVDHYRMTNGDVDAQCGDHMGAADGYSDPSDSRPGSSSSAGGGAPPPPRLRSRSPPRPYTNSMELDGVDDEHPYSTRSSNLRSRSRSPSRSRSRHDEATTSRSPHLANGVDWPWSRSSDREGADAAASAAIRLKNPSLRAHFAKLAASLRTVASQEDLARALARFVHGLPPFYAEAAAHYVATQRGSGFSINIDALVSYFAMLDQAGHVAATAPLIPRFASAQAHSPAGSTMSAPVERAVTPRTPPPQLTSHSLSPSPKRTAVAHLGRPRHHLVRKASDDHTSYADFAPSRPQLSNLLHSDERNDGGVQGLR